MTIESVDAAIDTYLNERLRNGREQAGERFLAYAYLRYAGDDLREFLNRVCGISRYYIDFLKVLGNPFRGPEMAWFASMLAVAVYALVIIVTDFDEVMLGIVLLVGAVVYGRYLIVTALKSWCDAGIRIAIYREIVELAEHEVESLT